MTANDTKRSARPNSATRRPSNRKAPSAFGLLSVFGRSFCRQFARPSNAFFVVILIMETFPAITLSDGVPVSVLALGFVVFLSAFKDLFEAAKRRTADGADDARVCEALCNENWAETRWSQLQVGDVVRLRTGETAPADMILLDAVGGAVFVDTFSLTGRTQTERRTPLPQISALIASESLQNALSHIEFEFEAPNAQIESLNANVRLSDETTHSLDVSNSIWNGFVLRGPTEAICMIAYTGKECKAALNSAKQTFKFSALELRTFTAIGAMVFLWVFLSAVCACAEALLEPLGGVNLVYLDLDMRMPWLFLYPLGRWMLGLSQLVPIALPAALDLARLGQGIRSSKRGYTVLRSALNDELARVTHAFLDKTGTLTRNEFALKRIIIGGTVYRADADFEAAAGADARRLLRFFTLCHAAVERDGLYSAASREELALLEFARALGFEFRGGAANAFYLQNGGNSQRYEIVRFIPFSENRKRMAIVLRSPEGKLRLLCKGAESAVLPLCKSSNGDLSAKATALAIEGFRVIVLAQRNLSESEVSDCSESGEELENGMELVGAVAIEEKLRENVAETIADLRAAEIKLRLLTGDALETAVAVARNAGILSREEAIAGLIDWSDTESAIQLLEELQKEPRALVVSGETLYELETATLKSLFALAVQVCDPIIFYRLSPQQKANLVGLERSISPNVCVLALGDGANDAAMLKAANIGIVFSGGETADAQRAADYAIDEFGQLGRLLGDGWDNRQRNSVLALYLFWKGTVIALPAFWRAVITSNYSASTVYEGMLYVTFSQVYTCIPIVLYAIFDKPPKGQLQVRLDSKTAAIWVVSGLTQALLLGLFGVFLSEAPDVVGPYIGLWGYGIAVFIMAQIVTIVKVPIISNSYQIRLSVASLLTVGLILPWMYGAGQLALRYSYALIESVFEAPAFYLFAVLVLLSCSVFDYICSFTQYFAFEKSAESKVKYEQINAEKLSLNAESEKKEKSESREYKVIV